MSSQAAPKRYRGTSIEERRAQRRLALIRAAVAVYGERGYRNATVKAVCDSAGVTERYFYESFANSEALLVASFEGVTRFLREIMETAAAEAGTVPAQRVRAILNAYYGTLKENPNEARVFLVEIAGVSRAVDEVLAESLRSFAEVLHQTLAAGVASEHAAEATPLLRAGVVGGIVQIALTWIASGYEMPVASVVDAAARLCSVLAASG